MESYAGNTYSYNANGELSSKINSSGTTTYNYDLLGNLRQVDPPLANDVIDYIIDGRNRRVAKKVDGTITKKWLYADQLNPIAELDLNDNITKRFIYGTRSNIPDVMVDVSGANPVVYRIISDHLGSPRFVIDISNGTTALELSYDEWGVETVVSGNRDLIPFGFAGGLYDQDTKLVRFGARDYDPEIGRWTSKDPIEFEGGDTNLFGYVLNDPINSIDPTGNCPWCVGAAVGGLADLALQLVLNGGKLECVDWGEVAIAAAGGATGFGSLDKIAKFAKARKAGKKAGSRSDNDRFPENPNDFLPELARDSKGRVYPSDKIRIRPEKHSFEPGDTYSPRHHGQHYHVETRKDPTLSWNNKNNTTKVKPPGYQPGQGTGFTPGEKFPGAK